MYFNLYQLIRVPFQKQTTFSSEWINLLIQSPLNRQKNQGETLGYAYIKCYKILNVTHNYLLHLYYRIPRRETLDRTERSPAERGWK